MRTVSVPLTLCLVALAAVPAGTQIRPGSGLASLKTVAVPVPADLDTYVRDRGMLEMLGKALFWDVQAGSDNRTACATCHFHAGADHRRHNQLASTPDVARAVPLNRALAPEDFPFLQFRNSRDRSSGVVRDTRLVAGSAGVPQRQFVDVSAEGAPDHGVDQADAPGPAVGGLKIRQATGRNTPSVINAVFNARNFHDGRASHVFTGLTPFGDSDTGLNALRVEEGVVVPHRVRLEQASLASQSMGPPVNAVEMSWAGRTWPKIGKKLLPHVALATQQVSPEDSRLGEFVNPEGPGLRPDLTYAQLVRVVYRPEFWDSPVVVDAGGRPIPGLQAPRNSDEYTLMEYNFALFWGLALQAYQATLVSNDSKFDQYAEGRARLTDQELVGLGEFQSGASQCSVCHHGPETTAASFTRVRALGRDETRPDRLGFFRAGVSPITDDVGAGGRDAFGHPFFPAASHESAAGAFKAPGLRNVEFTGPYFHTGGSSTLLQVLDFYARQSDFPEDGRVDDAIRGIEFGLDDADALLAFLKTLTDDRVKYERAPFDHPALCVPDGHPETAPGELLPNPDTPGAPLAADRWVLVPAVGRTGNVVPLQTFDELLRGIGNDGTRAHTMTQPCTPPGGAPALRR